ncbi:response regulator [Erythrobacter sp. WH158]|uniref:Response regulator n=2 Tax=Erythrobacter crassostreae TaxID=2828328 RepID=A0A9X1F1Z6_9SPHN|nr:response regulator [Erythrobacter crassostrea]MBV7258659.1 response regulator [Erythrobacter crassostrea]
MINSRPISILLAEDEPAMRAYLSNALLRQDYFVYIADSGLDALMMYEFLQGEIDLLVTDIVMPMMDGIELAQRLKQRYPNSFNCVFCTGFAAASLRAEEEFGSNSILTKPFHLRTFIEVVESKLNRWESLDARKPINQRKGGNEIDLSHVGYGEIFPFDPKDLFCDNAQFFAELEFLGCTAESRSALVRAIELDQGDSRRPRLGHQTQVWLSATALDLQTALSAEERALSLGKLFQLSMGFFGHFR